MAQGMGIGRVGAILNKVSSEAMATRTKQELEKRGVKVSGILNYSPELAETAFEGKAVKSGEGVKEAGGIVKTLTLAVL